MPDATEPDWPLLEDELPLELTGEAGWTEGTDPQPTMPGGTVDWHPSEAGALGRLPDESAGPLPLPRNAEELGYTSPGEHPSWGQFPAAGGWLCRHLWEHYAFSGDRKFLEAAYPILKESAEFYLDFLVEEPKHKWLVTSPSNSPENRFRTADGQEASVCAGPAMDEEIIRDLFTHCLSAAKLLGTDEDFRRKL